jgi:HAD superfamily hydrolase (TIGR01490 family)
MRLSIFDLDETITATPTFLRWIIFWVRTEAPWRAPLLLLAGLACVPWALGFTSRGGLKSFAARLAMGPAISRARLVRAASAFAERELRVNVLADAVARIAAERAEGRAVVLASASFHAYVSAFGDRLGAAAAIGTLMPEIDDERLRPVVYGGNVYAAEKQARVADWLRGQGVDRSAAHIRFFSDHISDAPMFGWADEAVAVNPRPALAALAAARGWRVERWR